MLGLALAGFVVPLACGGGNGPADEAMASAPVTTVAATSTAPTTAAAVATAVPPPASSAPVPVTAVATRPAGLAELEVDPVVAPVGVRIPSIDVDAEVVAVGADAGGRELAVPPTADLVAWYRHGPTPGAEGSAVLAAHVAYGGEAGAFVRLADLAAGDEVDVAMADGRALRFRVTALEQVPKPELPTEELFARDGVPRLVLVTCGGEFETATRHYRDNIVAYLEAVA